MSMNDSTQQFQKVVFIFFQVFFNLGLFATLVSGFHVIHLFIEILINAFIIKFASHR